MKKMIKTTLSNCTKMIGLAAAAGFIFASCSKSSSSANSGPVLPAQAIRGTTIAGGNVKGVMLAAATKSGNWEQLLAAVDATLEICAEPDVQRIIFIDAPTVIGPAAAITAAISGPSGSSAGGLSSGSGARRFPM